MGEVILSEGLLGICDRARPSYLRIYTGDIEHLEIQTATQRSPDLGLSFTTWLFAKLEKHLSHILSQAPFICENICWILSRNGYIFCFDEMGQLQTIPCGSQA
jgi:hypothetical protein